MSAEPLEPLPTHLRELIALESDAHPVDAALQAEVRARVELAVQLSGPGGPRGGAHGGGGAGGAAGAASVGAKKLLAVGIGGLLIGGGAGVLGSNLVRAPAHALAPPAITAPSDVATPHDVSTSPSVPRDPEEGKGVVDAPNASVAAPAHSARTPSDATRGDLTKERELLDVARAALARSRPSDAIAACEEHAKKWPHGYLSEEREVVLIQALVATGQRVEAERRAAQFRRTFRQSMLLPAVEMALDGGE